jgi:hypothetical protein
VSPFDNFGGYRDSIAAAIHYASGGSGEIKKTWNIYGPSAREFRIKRLW